MRPTVRSPPVVTVDGSWFVCRVMCWRSLSSWCRWRGGSAGEVAAVDRQGDAGDVAGLVGGQPDDRVGDLLGLGDAAERMGGHEVPVELGFSVIMSAMSGVLTRPGQTALRRTPRSA